MSSDSDLTPPPPSSQPEQVASTKRPAGPARRQSTRVTPSTSASRSASSRSQSPAKTGGGSTGAGGPRIKLKMGASSIDTPTAGGGRGTKRKSLVADADGEDASEEPAGSSAGRPTTYTKKRKSQADDPNDEVADSPAPKLKLKFSTGQAADSAGTGPDRSESKGDNATREDEGDTIVVENQEPVTPAARAGKKGGPKRKGVERRPDAAAEAISDLLEPSEDMDGDTIHIRAEDDGGEPKKKGKAVKVKRIARARDALPAKDADFEGDSMAGLFSDDEDEADDAVGEKSGKDDDFVPGDGPISEPVQASGKKAKAGGKSAAAGTTKKTARQASPEPEVQRKREPKPERRPAPSTARPAAPLGAGASAAAPVSSPAAPAKPDIPAGGIGKADEKAKPTTSAPGGPPKRAPVPLTGMMPKKKKPAAPGGAAGTATPTSSISLLQNTMAMIGKSPAATPTGKKTDPTADKKDTPKPVRRVGQWFEVWGMKPDEQKEFDASAEERAAQRAIRQSWRKAAVNLQASKDAYIVDSVRVRAIPEAGRAHSISTTGSVIEAVTTLHKIMGTNEHRASAGPTLADVSGPWL